MSRILVADDNAAVLAAVGQSLRDAGHLVTSTNSGADALCLLAGRPPPDLLLLDLRMPGVDGFAVLAALGPSAPPVVVMSGGELEGVPDPHTRRVLRKPFDQTQLLAAVASALAPAPARGPEPQPPAEEKPCS